MPQLLKTRWLLPTGAVLFGSLTVQEASAQPTGDVADQVEAVVSAYVTGADDRDGDRVAGALHDDVFHATVLPTGELSVVDKETYVGAIAGGHIGGIARTLTVGSVTMVANGLATVQAIAESEVLRFDYAFTLVREGSQWSILSTVSTATRR